METALNVLGWVIDHFESLSAVALGVAALTPTTHDDGVVDRIVNIGRVLTRKG